MSINVTEALNKETYAYKCWYNYNYGKNTLGISDADYSSIIGKWKDSISAWGEYAKDTNDYEISDSELDDYRKKGKESAKDATGYAGGGKGKMIANSVGDAVAGTAVAVVGNGVAKNAVGNGVKKVIGTKAGEAATKKFGKDAVSKLSDIATVVLASAVAAKYWIQKPNKDQVDACFTLRNKVLPEAQASLEETQDYMAETEEELLNLSEEAEEKNEAANDEIKEKKTDFDAERRIYDNLMSKKTSGEKLSEDEQIWLKEHAPLMAQISEEIDEISEGTSDEVNDLYDQMGEKEENYDEAAESIAEVDGIEDYAESFDSATKTSCQIEMGAQYLNALGAGVAAAKLVGKLFVGWVFAAMGFAAAAASGVAGKQQMDWAGQVGQEIDLRKATQAFSDETTEAYDEKVEVYEGAMGVVDDLELEIPDDLEVPEGVTTDGGEETQPDTGLLQDSQKDDDGKKKKEEK